MKRGSREGGAVRVPSLPLRSFPRCRSTPSRPIPRSGDCGLQHRGGAARLRLVVGHAPRVLEDDYRDAGITRGRSRADNDPRRTLSSGDSRSRLAISGDRLARACCQQRRGLPIRRYSIPAPARVLAGTGGAALNVAAPLHPVRRRVAIRKPATEENRAASIPRGSRTGSAPPRCGDRASASGCGGASRRCWWPPRAAPQSPKT